MKHYMIATVGDSFVQPPSGGCVLKHERKLYHDYANHQPPSGGCVLKLVNVIALVALGRPAAFRRLCVETLAGQLRL